MNTVKEEITNKRPSPLSYWVKDNLGTEFVISDIDWFIRSRNTEKIIIIEEKTVPSFQDILSITLGQAHIFSDVQSRIKEKNEIPIFIVFIEGENSSDIKKGVYVCKFEDTFLSDPECEPFQREDRWYLDVTKKCHKITEKELIGLYEKGMFEHVLKQENVTLSLTDFMN